MPAPGPRPEGAAAAGEGPVGEGTAGRIGPNAEIQLAAALDDAGLSGLSRQLHVAAGISHWLLTPPRHMVDERPVACLHREVRRALPPAVAARILADAGRLTADYVLANRIPGPVKRLLRLLPPFAASRLLLRAITAHAWTFAGSGRFRAVPGHPVVLELEDNPLCAGESAPGPVCAWHSAVFARLFADLVSRHARAVETACAAAGDPVCRFEVSWRLDSSG